MEKKEPVKSPVLDIHSKLDIWFVMTYLGPNELMNIRYRTLPENVPAEVRKLAKTVVNTSRALRN